MASLLSWFSSERWGKLQIANTVSFAINVFVVQTSNFGWYGQTNGDMSRKYQTFATPAGFAFAIWGVIYIAQLFNTIYMNIPSQRKEDNPVVRAMGPWWVAAQLLQVAWTFAFAQEQIILSCCLMAGIYVTLFKLVWNISTYREAHNLSIAEYWLYVFPFSIHLGWITAASIISGNLILRVNFAPLASQLGAGSLSVAVALLSASYFTVIRRDPVHPAVISWALFALSVQLADPENPLPYAAAGTPAVMGLSWASSAGSIVALVMSLLAVVLHVLHLRAQNHRECPTGVPAAPHGGRGSSLLEEEGEAGAKVAEGVVEGGRV